MNHSTRTMPSLPRMLLHLEGLVLLAAAIGIYASLRGDLWLFLILILAPDLGMLGYLGGARLGAMTYNALHTYLLPAVLITASWLCDWQLGILLGLIWFAHIGMDRLAGYGLKYPTAFKDSHLQRV